jgi:hypothetical protein
MHYFSTLFGKELYLFWTDLLSVIRSLNTVFTAIDICHTSYVAICWRSQDNNGNITSMTNTYCCAYSINTPDDRSKSVWNLYSSLPNKVEK